MNSPRLLLVALLSGASLSPAWADEAPEVGVVEFGGQSVRGDTHSSKFDEYKDVPRGAYIERFGLDLDGATYYFLLNGLKPGLRDQRTTIETGKWGVHKVSLSYDQIPHNLSNAAQTFLQDRGNGKFTLPDNMQSRLQTSTANAAGFFSDTPGVPLRTERKKGSISFIFNPTGQWRMNLGYSGEKKEGNKAIGVAYGHGQLQEALEPVDYQTHSAYLQSEYVGKKLGLSFSYEVSDFGNNIKALTVDNPFQLADGALSASGSSTPGTARLALPPDNQTHQFNMAVNAQTSAKSRLSGNLGYAVQLQDDPFLPLTSNSVILNDPRLPALPAPRLDGEVHTINAAARWNWKPMDQVSFNLHGKRYDVNNRTPSLTFTQYVPYDSSFSTGAPTRAFNPTKSRASLPLDYNQTGAGADLYYAPARLLSMKLAYDWERVGRRFRESTATKEDIYTASFKAGPFRGLTLRPSYQYARKTVSDYDAERVAEETFPLGEGTSLGQLPNLRKFDQAGRERHKTTLRAAWDLLDSFTAGVDGGVTRDLYTADYGVSNAETLYYSVDASVNPSQTWNLYADYTWEQMTSNTRSRYRATGLDLPANDWVGRLQDTVHTVNVGADCVLVPEKLDADLGWSLAYAKGIQTSYNPNTITTASALATDLPNTYNRLHKVRGTLRYHWTKNLTAKLGYEYQRYTETDWAQDSLGVYQTVWNKSVFLDAAVPGYEAHLVSLGMSYLF